MSYPAHILNKSFTNKTRYQ